VNAPKCLVLMTFGPRFFAYLMMSSFTITGLTGLVHIGEGPNQTNRPVLPQTNWLVWLVLSQIDWLK
jgi:hypothetical protein